MAGTTGLRGRDDRSAWQGRQACVAGTTGLRGRDNRPAWQGQQACVARTTGLRGRDNRPARSVRLAEPRSLQSSH